MTWFEAVILGIVEGLTEFLPISSTAHLLMAERVLGLTESEFAKTFTIVIQVGAIAAVLALYCRRLLVDRQVMLRVAVAFVPTGLIGLSLYPQVKGALQDDSIRLWSLAVGGLVLILFEQFHGEKPAARDGVAQISLPAAFAIGVFQALALFPGVSRAAATVVGGLALGYRRRTIVEFSFLLGVPTIAAAAGYELYKSRDQLSFEHVHLLAIGLAVSFVAALLAIKLLIRFVQTHSFAPFGVYRLLLAGVFAALLLGGWLN